MKNECFPDGTAIDSWFYDLHVPTLANLGTQYILTDYGIFDDGRIYTKEIQKLIDTACENGGGVIVVPRGTYMTGSLFFKQGVHLYVSDGGVLKGSSDISDYELRMTRIEGETCLYFTALINADGVDGFTMCGPGTIDGNGLRSWKAFWLRRTWNPKCTNKDEQRPRLVYLSNSRNVLVADLHMINSHFWTNHIYKCDHVKYLNCVIYSPAAPVKAPSTDAIDIDVCTDVLVKNCYLEVNDDSIVLKGGKGPWADTAEENGSNERILVEDCVYGFCHGCLTCGSESVHNRNILIRRIRVKCGMNLVWLKMRPDTPQHYEYITVEEVEGKVTNFVNINPWTQFFDLKGRKDIPLSVAEHIQVKNCTCECETYFNVKKDESQYLLSDFRFENLQIRAKKDGFAQDVIRDVQVKDVRVELIGEEGAL
ncbi:MAG: exopolygalacturonase [Lachnospiraceae bacterium]|nr:exopolygalacturonase [Lachnospiraceae bacterium]